MTCPWRGVLPAATTEFHDDQALDIPGTLAHLEALIDGGCHGLILLGTVGENCSLDAEEKRELLRAAVGHVGGRLPVLSGVAETSTRLACQFAKDAREAGVDGLMILPAMAYPTSPRETIAHIRAIANATDLPILVDNNPVAHSADITPAMFAELADLPEIVAIKESSADVRRITDLANRYDDRLALFCGVDDLALESLVLGASGWVSGLVNAFPTETRWLWDLATEGRWREARDVYRWYSPLLRLGSDPRRVQLIKLAAQETGLGSETVRAPRLTLDGDERHRIIALVREAIRTRPRTPAKAV